MPRKDNAKTQKQKIEEKKAKEQSKADKNNDRNKTKTNIYSTGGNKTTGGTMTKPATKPTGSTGNKSTGGTTTKPTTKPTGGTTTKPTTKPTGGTITKPTGTATKPTSGGTSSGSSVSKGVEDIFKGNSSSKNNWDNTKAGNTVKDVAGSGNTGGSTGNTGGVSLPSVSKDNKAAWGGVAKGDMPATAPGLPTGGTTTKSTGGTTTKPTSGGTSSGGGSVSKGVSDIFKDNSSSKSNWDNTKAGSTVNNTAGSGNTGGISLPSVSKDNKAAWDDFAKGNGPATAPGLPTAGTVASKPSTPSTPNTPSTSGGSVGDSGKPSQTTTGTSSSGYDNGGLTAEQIKAMQRFYGTNADGMWGANSTAAAGGKTAADAWNAYQTALREQLEQQQQQQGQQGQQGQQPGTGTPGTGTTLPGAPAGSTGKVTADVSGMRNLLDQWLSAAKQQQEAAINYGVEQGVNELRRAEEDAQQQYQAQQDQINIDEARAKDNQALYAEARGDRGGIGAAQYDSIMNAAAQNRLTVSQQQTKLSTDTARQIADLRAQGEYKKADAVLELTQKYLTQLMSLEQWALNYQMDVAQFNLQLEKWQADYALSLAKLKGTSTGGTSSGGSGGTYTGGSGGTSSGSSGVNPSAMTSAEVKEWQRKLGVTADGIWGPNTQAAYDKLMNPNKNQDPHIVNPSSTSSGWVAIPGHGRFSYQELKVLVDKGKVKETKKSDGTYAYTWVNK